MTIWQFFTSGTNANFNPGAVAFATGGIAAVGGGGGGYINGSIWTGSGGGGGACAHSVTDPYVPTGNDNVNGYRYSVGTGGTGGSTGSAGGASSIIANNGSGSTLVNVAGGGAGNVTGAAGTVTTGTGFSGGAAGGDAPASGASGGGGSAGPNGAGKAGGLTPTGNPGGGGGGGGADAGSSTAGSAGATNGTANAGGAGGANSAGTGGGAAGAAADGAGGTGTNGGGGGGGGANNTASGTKGAGGTGSASNVNWDATHGVGGGGGGGGGDSGSGGTAVGGTGGTPPGAGGGGGGGGAGAGSTQAQSGLGGAGAAGLVVFAYTLVALNAWGFDEPQYQRITRRAQHPLAQVNDIAGFSFTAVVTPTKYYEEEPQRRDPRRFPKTAFPQVLAEEFLKNPTQFPAPPWVQDPDYFPRRIRSWRAHPEPLREEFLNNPTQAVFANWAFDEPRWRGSPRPLRQPANSQPSDSDMPPLAVAPMPFSDDDARARPTRRQPWSPPLRTDTVEGLPFTAATITNWPDIDQPTGMRRRTVQARFGQDEFLLNPTQSLFSAWGFDEENHRLERRIFRRLTAQDDPFGLPQLVGVPWGFEEEPQHAVPHRRAWRGYSEPLREEFLLNPTQTAFVGWGFEEELHRLQRWPFHRLTQQDDPLGSVQLVGVSWAFEEEAHRQQRRIFHRLVQQDDPLGLVQLVGVGWGFEEEAHGRFKRWPLQRSLVLSEEFVTPPTQTAFVGWGFEEELHRLQRQPFHRLTQQDDPLGLVQLVGVGWGFEEEAHGRFKRWPLQRSLVLSEEFVTPPARTFFVEADAVRSVSRLRRWPFLQSDDWFGTVPLFPVAPGGWEQEPVRVIRRAWMVRSQSGDEMLVGATSGPVVFDVDQCVRPAATLRRPRVWQDEVFPQFVIPWGWEAKGGRKRFGAIFRSIQQDDLSSFLSMVSLAPFIDAERNVRAQRRVFRGRWSGYDDLVIFPSSSIILDVTRRYLVVMGRVRYTAPLARTIYTGLIAARYYTLKVPAFPGVPWMPQIIDLPPIAPSQVQTCAIDFGNFLPTGVMLTGTPIVTISVHSGIDSSPTSRVVGGPTVGTAATDVGGTGKANTAVLFQLGGCLMRVVYLIEVDCNRSDGDVAEAWTHIACVSPS